MLKKNHSYLKLLFLWLYLSFFSGPAFASGPELTLVGPQGNGEKRITSGAAVIFTVLFTNPESQPAPLLAYQSLDLTLSSGREVILETSAKPYPGMTAEIVQANGFVKQAYRFDLPGDIHGNITLSLAGLKSNPVMFHANASPVVQDDPALEKAPETKSVAVLKNLQHPFYSNFSTYEPIYFLFGAKPGIESTKFQLSFKYRIFDLEEQGFLRTYLPMLEKLHFAYTQTSFWNLESDSAPFEDSRYMPEIFYYNDNIDLGISENLSFGFQSGYQHESNGRGGNLSRSTNYLYAEPVAAYHIYKDFYIKVAPRVWIYVHNEDENNPDLHHYRGYFNLETKIGSVNGLVLETNFRSAEKGSTWQFDLSYPMKKVLRFDALADFYIHAQYFTGYAENLLDYREKEEIIRLGLSLIR